jgi:hypothetical protein
MLDLLLVFFLNTFAKLQLQAMKQGCPWQWPLYFFEELYIQLIVIYIYIYIFPKLQNEKKKKGSLLIILSSQACIFCIVC